MHKIWPSQTRRDKYKLIQDQKLFTWYYCDNNRIFTCQKPSTRFLLSSHTNIRVVLPIYTYTSLFFSLNSKPKTLSSKLLPIFSGSFLLFLIDNNKGTRVSCGVLPLGRYFVRENRLKKGGCRFRFGPFSLRIVLWLTPRYISFSFLLNSSLPLRLVTLG